MELGSILIALAVAAGIYAVMVYNALQTTKTRITASIQEIGNQLKRQADLIPGLLESTKGFMKHEKEIFDMLTEVRKQTADASTSSDAKQIDKAEQLLQSVLPKMQILVESNPELKSNETVTTFMNELRDTADKVMYSRRVLIDLTQDLNQRLVTFPSNLVANLFGFKEEKGLSTPMSGAHLEVSEKDTQTPTVKL